MAKWQITDWDLIDTNIADWVEIFWVTGNYTNMTIDTTKYYVWWPALSWDLWSWWYNIYRWYLRFYDDWTKIIIMWCSLVQSSWASLSQYWWAYYYAEILKSTWVLTVYPHLNKSLWTSVPYWNPKLVYVSWAYYFTAAPNDSSSWFVGFNWTQVVNATAAPILAASNIWSSSISYRWKTLSTGTLFQEWDTAFYWAGWGCLQTLYYG